MSCTGLAASGTGEFVYTDDAYTGQMVMNERAAASHGDDDEMHRQAPWDCTK